MNFKEGKMGNSWMEEPMNKIEEIKTKISNIDDNEYKEM